jgi:hypothetical protein
VGFLYWSFEWETDFAKNNEDLVKELRKGSESGEVLKCDSFQEA